jgi:hypothetical protein
MIPASEALRLPCAQLTPEESAAADVIDAEIDAHLRENMRRGGATYDTKETRGPVIADDIAVPLEQASRAVKDLGHLWLLDGAVSTRTRERGAERNAERARWRTELGRRLVPAGLALNSGGSFEGWRVLHANAEPRHHGSQASRQRLHRLELLGCQRCDGVFGQLGRQPRVLHRKERM